MKNFQWKITDIKVKDYEELHDVAVSVDWNYGDIGGISSIAGVCQLGVPEALGFISFPDLTENEVIGWVEQNLGAAYIQNLQNKILQNIEEIRSLPISKPIPWLASS
jgi:hypothetical protein